jgi:hypothetical protein
VETLKRPWTGLRRDPTSMHKRVSEEDCCVPSATGWLVRRPLVFRDNLKDTGLCNLGGLHSQVVMSRLPISNVES